MGALMGEGREWVRWWVLTGVSDAPRRWSGRRWMGGAADLAGHLLLLPHVAGQVGEAALAGAALPTQIGRASCRERVYVLV